MRRSLFLTGVLALAALALPSAALYWAAFTPSGLAVVTRLIPRRVGHLRLGIEGVSGTAAHGVHIERLEIDDRRVHLVFAGVSGRIALAPLLVRTLRVPQLTIGSLYIHVRPRGAYAKRSRWHFLPPGLRIEADEVKVASATLIVPSGRRILAAGIDAAGVVRRQTARIDRASLDIGEAHIAGRGTLRAGKPFGMDVRTLVTVRAAGEPVWVIDARGQGTVDELGLDVRFVEPLSARFTGEAVDLTRDWRWRGRAHVERFELAPWHGSDTALGRVTGELALEGNRGRFTASGTLESSSLPNSVFDAAMRGAYARRVITVDRLAIRHRGSGASITGRGEIGIVARGPALSLAGTWSDFRWPLAGGTAVVRSASGRYDLEGLWPYRLRASGQIAARHLAPVAFDLTGRLGKRHLGIESASLAAFGGTAHLASGSLAWAPRRSWSASGSAVDVDPSSLWADVPGRVSFAFDAAGSHLAAGTAFSLAIHRLEGTVRGLPASGTGSVSRRGSRWTLRGVAGRIGRAAFALGGTIDHSLDLHFRVAASDLAALDPRLAGHLRASGTLSGPRGSPAVDAVATGGAIRYADVSVRRFAARVDFDPRASAASLVTLTARDLARGRHRLNVDFTLAGRTDRERAHLTLAGASYRLDARAAGALAAGAWTGRIESLGFTGGGERLALEGASALSVSRRAVRLDRLCVAGGSTRICWAARWTPDAWSATGLASGVPLGLLTAGVSRDLEFRGLLGARLEAAASSQQPARGHLVVTLAGARMIRSRKDGRREATSLGAGTLTVDAAATRMTARLALDAGTVGSIDATIAARRTTHGWTHAALAGTIAARTSLAVWAPLDIERVDRASGLASADLILGGSLATPRITGTVGVANGAVDLYRYNLDVRDAGIAARLTDHGLDFTGAAHIGSGAAKARGHLEWRRGAPYGRLELSGTNLRLVDLPEAVVDASPNLDFAMDGKRVTVTGTVDVPHARIAPANTTNAVRVSPDQIIVGETPTRRAPRLEVSSSIKIELGPHVRLETEGLKGRLTGSVAVETREGSVTRATGQLAIADGTYAAYGRTLDIASGRLIYTGSPVSDPGIDIRAERTFEDPDVGAAVAGMDVRGTLREPRITFFSEPPLPQQQIVSLVLAGGTLIGGPQLGPAPAASTSRSVNAQLIGQGAAMLGSQFGLPVAIEPTYDNDTALVLGKYLSPRLYVSYGITLVQSLNIVKLRYTLGDHWSVSTELGQLGGADLVYSFGK